MSKLKYWDEASQAWLTVDSGGSIPVSEEEPEDAPELSLWVDLDEEGESGSGGSVVIPENVVTCDLEGATEDESTVPVNADTLGGFPASEYTRNGGLFYKSGWQSDVSIPADGTVTNVASITVPSGVYVISAQLVCSGDYDMLYIRRGEEIIASKLKASNNDLIAWVAQCEERIQLSLACKAWSQTTASGSIFAASLSSSGEVAT